MIGRGGVESILKYHGVGFDLDHTLVRYRLKAFTKRFYEAMCVFLVNHRGYPQEVFPADEPAERRVFAMLFKAIFDHRTGFLLKMSCTLQVMRAFFGFERVADEELFRVYGNPPRLEGYGAGAAPGFTDLHEYSAAVQCPLLAQVVELRKRGDALLAARSFAQIMADIADAADHNLRVPDLEVFKSRQYPGYFLPDFLSHPRRYLHAVSPPFLERLARLQRRGVLTFIISNSHYHTSNIVLKSCIGADWRSFFSFAIFDARKSAFFDLALSPPPPFTDLAGAELSFPAAVAAGERVFLGGHVSALHRYFFARVNKNFSLAFCSDTIATDCVLVRDALLSQHWDLILVLEELQELEYGLPAAEYYDCAEQWGSGLFDRNLSDGGVEQTTLFRFASMEARRAFSKLDSEDCLEVFDV